MKHTVLITGGAGFIGSHVVPMLLKGGHSTRILDSLDPQVHSDRPQLPSDAEFVHADVTDPDVWDAALDGVTAVLHLAAVVGVGQSMYEIVHYCNANVMGTAHLLQNIVGRKDQITKLVVASSMSIYGEGPYRCPECGLEAHVERSPDDLTVGRWDPPCPSCRAAMDPLPTSESKIPVPRSIYAVNKRDQEEMCLSIGRAYGLSTIALRFFNVYGPGQSLGNPYTGVAAIFASRLLAGAPPLIFEDGRQSRDFVHVRDIARACVAAIERDGVSDQALNLGTGRSVSVAEMAALLQRKLGGPDAEILDTYRAGDIRHCFADISAAREELGWEPEIALEDGIDDLVSWVGTQLGYADRLDGAMKELRAHGLVH